MKIDWNHPQRRSRTVKGKERYENYYRVTCTCGNERWLRKSDALKMCPCLHCSQSAKGRKGYKATVARHGVKTAVKHLQAHRREFPSFLEREVIHILDDLGIWYERELELIDSAGNWYLMDFTWETKVIEVNGAWAHSFHAQRDERKAQVIRSQGYELLILEEHNFSQWSEIVQQFVKEFLHVPAFA